MVQKSSIFSSSYTEDEIVEMAVSKGHGVKGLSEMALDKLPQRFVQPSQERKASMPLLGDETIPIIDLSKWDEDPNVSKSICDAAQKWGFFQVVNHGIPSAILDNVKEAAARFFELPAEEKIKYSKGYSPNNNVRFTTSFVPDLEKALEWKDSIGLVYVSDHEAHALWPSVCRNEVLDYLKSSEILSRKLLATLIKGINVGELDEAKESLLMGSKRINLICYPACPDPELTVGVGRHSDVSTLTILLQDDTGGLYVRKVDGDGWIAVPPRAGALVINIGDVLEIMSNSRYKSVEHRVFAPTGKTRFSVPVFVNPKPSDIVGPLLEVLQMGDQPIYKQVLYSNYVKNFFKTAHNGKSTLDFAKI